MMLLCSHARIRTRLCTPPRARTNMQMELSSTGSASVSLPFITADQHGPKHLETAITRAKFGGMLDGLLQGTLGVCDDAMAAAGMRNSEMDAILLVGE